VRQAVGGDGGA
jgi:hypothetical protein